MTQAEFLLNENLLPILSRLAGDNPQPISPWAQIEPVTEMDNKAWKLLEEADLCDGGRHLKKEVQDTIVLLNVPSRFVRLRLMNGPTITEHIIYSCGPEQMKVSLSSSAEGLIVGSPAPLEQIMVGFLEHWGDSTLASSSLKLRLGRETSLVFAALVDLHRRDMLSTWASMSDFKDRVYTFNEIRDSLDDPTRDGQWLVNAVGTFSGWGKTLSVEEIREALSILIEKKVTETGNDGFLLANDGLSFANNFPLISQALRLEVGAQESSSEVVLSKMLCLQAGMRDHLYLEKDEDMLSVEAVSAHYIAEMVDSFLAGKYILQNVDQPSGDSNRSYNRDKKNNSDPMGLEADMMPHGEQPRSALNLGVVEPEQQATAKIDSQPQSGRWYISRGEEQYGPYTDEDMFSFAQQGNLHPEDLIWSEETGDWVRADSVGMFFTQ
jgi:hypothetical protein